MRKSWVLAFALVLVLILPDTVAAVVGTFSSSTSTPAVKAGNTGSGHGAVITSTARNGVYAVSRGSTTNASGVLGFATASSGATNGVWGRSSSPDGTGVYGLAPAGTGVLGDGATGVGGMGDDFGVFSLGNLGALGNVVSAASDDGVDLNGLVAGTCFVQAGSTQDACSFAQPFGSGLVPIVVVSPLANPGSFYWVSALSATGFTITLASVAPAGGVDFAYVVIAVLPISASQISALRTVTRGELPRLVSSTFQSDQGR